MLSFCEKVLGLVKGRLTDNYEPAGTIVDALFYDKTPEGKWGTKESRIIDLPVFFLIKIKKKKFDCDSLLATL